MLINPSGYRQPEKINTYNFVWKFPSFVNVHGDYDIDVYASPWNCWRLYGNGNHPRE